jgi:excisionase family DNA binding protein
MLTPAELAAHLRTSERTVARMVRDGCPSMLVGSRRRFDLAAVLAWTSAQATLESGLITQGTSLENQVAAASKRVDASIAMLRHL